MLRAVDRDASADEIIKEYIEVTVAEALEDLLMPGAGDFFGRTTEEAGGGPGERWYIGRRHIEDGEQRAGGGRLAGADRCAVQPGDPR